MAAVTQQKNITRPKQSFQMEICNPTKKSLLNYNPFLTQYIPILIIYKTIDENEKININPFELSWIIYVYPIDYT